MAQQVVQDLVSRFIDENTRNQSNATIQTTQFMKDADGPGAARNWRRSKTS